MTDDVLGGGAGEDADAEDTSEVDAEDGDDDVLGC